ncbi:MAG: hypothetical protein Q8O57_02840 [Kiritimatiellota bacterium]|nr:hypothetical protein [Kiritimatiellota bacterium]
MKMHRFLTIGIVVFAFIFAQGVLGQTLKGPTIPQELEMTVPPISLVADGKVSMLRSLPPANLAAMPKTSTFTINYLTAGQANYYGDVGVTWPEDAKAAFSYAASIWASLLDSAVPIVISACWANMNYISPYLLGHGGARSFYKDFTGAPQASTYYPVATANALYGSDLNDDTEEIVIAYNAERTDWYMGTDGNCPATKIDFASVVLHEMCHGLGFLGSMSKSGSSGSWGSGGYPFIYDQFTEDGSGQKLITAYANPSTALGTVLTSGNVYFDGANANSANAGAKVKLYAPSTWASGSSYSHLDESFNNTVNALMTYSLSNGEVNHDPGPVTKGLLKDVGWTQSSPGPTPPTPTQVGQPIIADYDGDGYGDLGLLRTTDGSLRLLLSYYGYYNFPTVYDDHCFAQPGDFDGDRLADPAVLDTSSGYWRFCSSYSGYDRYYIPTAWYASGMTPVCGDYDGDRYADPIVYDSSDGNWYILSSRYDWDGHYYQETWGGPGYSPVCADFDGDRFADPMAYETASGYWYILSSRYSYNFQVWFGLSGYTPLSGDFDGDGYADLAIYNKTTGMWYILLSYTGWDINQVIGGIWDGSPR